MHYATKQKQEIENLKDTIEAIGRQLLHMKSYYCSDKFEIDPMVHKKDILLRIEEVKGIIALH